MSEDLEAKKNGLIKVWILLITVFVSSCVIFSPTRKLPRTKYSFSLDFGLAPFL